MVNIKYALSNHHVNFVHSEIFELSDYYEEKVAEQQARLDKVNATTEDAKRERDEEPSLAPIEKKLKVDV